MFEIIFAGHSSRTYVVRLPRAKLAGSGNFSRRFRIRECCLKKGGNVAADITNGEPTERELERLIARDARRHF